MSVVCSARSRGVRLYDDFSARPSHAPGAYEARRRTVFWVAFLGYAACYLVRNNTAVVSEILVRERGWTPVEVGWILTAFSLTYGVGKLVLGVLVDRMSLRTSFAGAMAISALVCVVMAFLPTVTGMALAMGVIGLVQGACAPAALSVLGAWYPPSSRGSRVAVWNTSQNVGAALLPLVVAGGMLFAGPNSWPVAFWLPGLLALATALWALTRGGDRPWREGWPTLPELYGPTALPTVPGSSEASYWRLVRVHVLTSRVLIILAVVNAILYLVRFGILNWIPLYLITERGFTQAQAHLSMVVFEAAAVPGALVFAVIAWRWPNRMALAGSVSVVLLSFCVLAYALLENSVAIVTAAGVMGALTYGPQVIVNILTLNFVSPRATGVAVGFVGLGGYLVGEVVANLALPALAGWHSWSITFVGLAASCLAAAAGYALLARPEREAVQG